MVKRTFSILLLIFSVVSVFAQGNLPSTNANDKSFPTNIDNKNFDKLKEFVGKIVAFDAAIEEKKISRSNTPFYKLRISKDNYLWTVLMFTNEDNNIGDSIRVAGYLGPIQGKLNEAEKKYLDGTYMVIAFGLVDLKNSLILFAAGSEKQKQQWIDGQIPDGL